MSITETPASSPSDIAGILRAKYGVGTQGICDILTHIVGTHEAKSLAVKARDMGPIANGIMSGGEERGPGIKLLRIIRNRTANDLPLLVQYHLALHVKDYLDLGDDNKEVQLALRKLKMRGCDPERETRFQIMFPDLIQPSTKVLKCLPPHDQQALTRLAEQCPFVWQVCELKPSKTIPQRPIRTIVERILEQAPSSLKMSMRFTAYERECLIAATIENR